MAADPEVPAALGQPPPPDLDGAAGEIPPPPRGTRQQPIGAGIWTSAAVVAAAFVVLVLFGGGALPERSGPPVENLEVVATVLRPGAIELDVRNAGPDPVQVAQVFVNDAFVDVTGGTDPIGRLEATRLTLDYPWQEGQPYLVSMLTATGLIVEHEIAAAAETPATVGVLGLMALLGTYVGIIPVALGMLALPILQRAGPGAVRGVLAVTVGLLAFLAVDGGVDAIELGSRSGLAFGGPALALMGAVLAFLALTAADGAVRGRAHSTGGGRPEGARLALMIAVAIGLHNLGEGLAIGSAYAIGELALGASLVIGFALHNVTEGVAIVAPLARRHPGVVRLAALALVAGAPAILGAVVGATVNSGALSTFLLGLGIGAIAQVIVTLTPALQPAPGRPPAPSTIGGIALGVVLMYATGLLVTA